MDKLKLWNNLELVGLLRCLVEDTVHCNDLRKAPLINSALGISIRWAGLTRPKGGDSVNHFILFDLLKTDIVQYSTGAKGFWKLFCKRYKELGGSIQIKLFQIFFKSFLFCFGQEIFN